MKNLNGSIVAIVTPMQLRTTTVDYVRFSDLLKWHLEQGSDGIVIAGSTGEGATLTSEECMQLLSITKQTVKHKIPIIVATGTNCTDTTIQKTLLAQNMGADAALIVTPYYNKPTQLGLKLHFQEIAKYTNLPIILYNVPSRTGCNLEVNTIIELSNISNIVGIKDATGDLDIVEQLSKSCSKNFILLSGDDASFLDFMLKGGHGVISVTANVLPALMHKLCNLVNEFKLTGKKQIDLEHIIQIIQQNLIHLHKMLMVESNPIPVKWLLSHLGKIEDVCRLPLTSLSEKYHNKLITTYTSLKDVQEINAMF